MALDIVRLSVSGSSVEVADLADWLDEDDALRGRVRREVGRVPDGALGGELQQLVVGLTSSGVATAVASVIVAWLRRRTGSVTVRVSRSDGFEVELRADQVRSMNPEQLRAQVDQLVSAARPDSERRKSAEAIDDE